MTKFEFYLICAVLFNLLWLVPFVISKWNKKNLDLWRKNLHGGDKVTFLVNGCRMKGKIGYLNTSTGQFIVVPENSNFREFFCDATDLLPGE